VKDSFVTKLKQAMAGQGRGDHGPPRPQRLEEWGWNGGWNYPK
jgi:hypothetical protein